MICIRGNLNCYGKRKNFKMAKKLKYCIQKHKATHLHYDLRLEHKGAAKSWAIPKEPPRKIGEKRLAIPVADHDISYMKWEGTIPKGQYGAGTVKVWDSGYYEPIEISANKFIIDIHGKKLKGKYNLVKFRDKNWLFFKAKEVKK